MSSDVASTKRYGDHASMDAKDKVKSYVNATTVVGGKVQERNAKHSGTDACEHLIINI